jgi:two-component system chemotaxis response regulator CheY
MREKLKMVISKTSHTVVGEATNGAESVEKTKELQPDLITMDITMPEMDGIQALKEIRKFNATVKVIMVTAMGQETLVRDAITAGASNFIVKPFADEKVIEAIDKLSK